MKIHSSNRGVALILVLSIIVLLAGLIIAIFSAATSQRVSAVSNESQMRVNTLAESTVKIVIGQVADASRSDSAGEKLAWSSQPGMIRTYSNSGSSKFAYKLYSANEMVVDPGGSDSLATVFGGGPLSDNPGNWSSLKGLFVDLNSPVKNSQGDLIFPIVDPRAMSSTSTDSVEGFSYSAGIDGVVIPGGNPDAQRLPMPVQWLYVLKDGSLSSPNRPLSIGGKAVWSAGGVNAPTAANPIVGRVAFWTDDESSKVNINTAAEGTYWDVPHVNTDEDRAFANYQPAFNEFQRYPGHPAGVSLSTVLFPNQTLTPAQKESIYSIIPRVNGGGSKAGTSTAGGKIVPDKDRLYANVDELLFAPDRSRYSLLTPASLQRSKFFLTTNSRASEVNLFHLPRVAIWPINANSTDPTYRSAFDNVIARCATIGGSPFYFQRSDSTSPTSDYLNIARNRSLYSYLYDLTGQHFPGTSGSGTFAAKYGGDRAQILTEITDYIRSTNLFDDLLEVEVNPNYNYPTIGKQFTAARANPFYSQPGHGQVAPLRIDAPGGEKTMGFGRFYSVSEAAIQFICNADSAVPASNNPATNLALDESTPLLPNQRRVQAVFLLEFSSPMVGSTMIVENMEAKVTKLEGFKLNSTASLGFPSSGSIMVTEDVRNLGGDSRGGTLGYLLPLLFKGIPARGRIPADPGATYPFVSVPVTVDVDPATNQMLFSGGNIEVELLVNSVSIQKLQINFPPQAIPVPELAADSHYWTFNTNTSGRKTVFSPAGQPGDESKWIIDKDVVRSMIPLDGDIRLAYKQTSSSFQPHPKYTDATAKFAHTLRSNAFAYGAESGKLVQAADYLPATYSFPKPDVPTVGTYIRWDWDNGIGLARDGAFVNKPDEGAVKASATQIPYFTDNKWDTPSGGTFFSPNRQIPSPGMFGSLPSRLLSNTPWQTLLFRPDPTHPGAANPPDYLLMDLYWMPVVEPYAISEPFSTAGKINLNHQILPFTNIVRSTGLNAALKNLKMLAIPTNQGGIYKKWTDQNSSAAGNVNWRRQIDAAKTINAIDGRFANWGTYVSESEICSVPLIPVGESASSMNTFWGNNALTGDNMRERPYTDLYPLLTTRSDTYTVHYRVQALKKAASNAVTEFVDPQSAGAGAKDQILSEYRGSTTIQRYIDPTDPNLPDFATDPSANIDNFYRFRILEKKTFAP